MEMNEGSLKEFTRRSSKLTETSVSFTEEFVEELKLNQTN